MGRFRSGTILIAAAIVVSGLDFTSLAVEVLGQTGTEIEKGEPKRIPPKDVMDRGLRLRADLDKAFNGLLESGKAGHANEFTAVVLPYISAGTALEDAESILRAAGFTDPLRPRTREGSGVADWYVVVAEIPQFAGRVFGDVEAYVMLLPPEQDLAEFAGRRHRLIYYPRP